ncbi:MAG: carbohydrate porin [Caldimonas sp.]
MTGPLLAATPGKPEASDTGAALSSDLAPDKSVAASIESSSPPPIGVTGDWNGIRKHLMNEGVTITSQYQSQPAYNLSGGDRHVLREAGQFDIAAKADLNKLVGLSGGTFKALATWRRGEDLGSASGIDPLEQVQEIYGRGHTWRLTQFWYEQVLGEHASLKLGRSAPNEDFAAFSCNFMNLSFCSAQPGSLVGSYWYDYPISQWTARLRVTNADGYLQGAAYEVNPKNLENRFTIGYLHGATGVLLPVEAGWMPVLGPAALPGLYKIGAWYSSVDAPDVTAQVGSAPGSSSSGAAQEHSGRYGGWINLEQQVTGMAHDRHALSGITLFLNATLADRRTSFLDQQISIGMFLNHPFASRSKDVLGIGLARTHVNDRVTEAQRLAGNIVVQQSEYAGELFYEAHVASWFTLRPDLQYIHHPGGRNVHDAVVVGLRSAIAF